jgi:hypothetical protein
MRRGQAEGTGHCDAGGEEAPDGHATDIQDIEWKSCWFTMASDSERVTRQSADPLNIRPGSPRLDIRRYFYSQRVVESWNNLPLDIKKSVSVKAFKNAYRRHRDDMIAPA